MRTSVIRGLSALVLVSAATAAGSVTVDQLVGSSELNGYGQKFYSDTVSRVSHGGAQACMVSSGSDWDRTGMARRATAVLPLLERHVSIDEAYESTRPVSLKGISSNTPYISFVIDEAGESFVRIVTGFQIDPAHVDVRFGAGPALSGEFEIEPRGDSGVISNSSTVDDMLAAFMASDPITIDAKSSKTAGKEHFVRYQFQAEGDVGALAACLSDLENEDVALRPGSAVKFELAPATDAVAEARLIARAAACNRDLDPNEAELMQITGEIDGFATPLAYALAQRDQQGGIAEIWSGDLWRISRIGTGYGIAISNSIAKQSPMAAQAVKSCTSFGATKAIGLNVGEDGSIAVLEDAKPLLAAAQGLDFAPVSNFVLPGVADPISRAKKRSALGQALASANRAAAPQIVLGGKAADSISAGSASDAGTLVSDVVSGDDTPFQPTANDTFDAASVSAVPVPGAGLMLLSALGLMGGGRLRRKATK